MFCIEFDKSLDGVFSAGNKYICNYQAGNKLINFFILYCLFLFTEKSMALQDVGIAAIAILALTIAIGPVICILIGIKSYQCGHRHGYKQLDLPNDQAKCI